jgi:periplasmic protein TonB
MSDRDGLGNLAQCMVDSDRSAKTRAKRLRRKALAASILLEAAIVVAVVVWPLMTLGVLPSQAVVTPLRPYRGFREPQPMPPELPRTPHDHPANRTQVFQPPSIPQHITPSADSDLQPPGIEGLPGPSVPGIADGFTDGRPIEIVEPSQPPQTKILTRNASVMEAMLVHRVQPEYPGLAKNIGLSGTVILRARIGTDGEVRDLQLVSGNVLLARSALEAVRQWRYRPTMLNGQAVEVETQVTVNFVLN